MYNIKENNKKNKIKETSSFKTLNTVKIKTSLIFNENNKNSKNSKNRNIVNSSIQLKEKRKLLRTTLLNNHNLINKNTFGFIKKNNTDFINTVKFDINKYKAKTINKNDLNCEYYE